MMKRYGRNFDKCCKILSVSLGNFRSIDIPKNIATDIVVVWLVTDSY